MTSKINLDNKILEYKTLNPELKKLSNKEVLSIMVKNGYVKLTKEQEQSLFSETQAVKNVDKGLVVEKNTVDPKIKLENLNIVTNNGETINVADTLNERLNNVLKELETSEKSNGFLGQAWSGFKNLTNIGDSSEKVREQQKKEQELLQEFSKNPETREKIFLELTGLDLTKENLEKFLNKEVSLKSELALKGYQEGQEMATDVAGDMVSGIAAVGIYTASVAAAPFTGGASIALGFAAATASGAVIKTGLKYADAKSAGREYTLKDATKDAVTGGFSGALAPLTGGIGGAVGKTVATKLGIQAVKQVGEEVVEQGVKTTLKQGVKIALTNPTGYEYVGGNIIKRGVAMSAEMATDGALGGGIDGGFRSAFNQYTENGEIDWKQVGGEALTGTVGGAIMSPAIGGGMKFAGKTTQKLFGKNNVEIDANGKMKIIELPLNEAKTKLSELGLSEEQINRINLRDEKINHGIATTLKTDKLPPKDKPMFIKSINDTNKEYVDRVLNSDIPSLFKLRFMERINDVNKEYVDVVLNTDKLLPKDKPTFMGGIRGDNKEYVDVVLNTDKLPPKDKPMFIKSINDTNKEYVDRVLNSDIPSKDKPMFMYGIRGDNKEYVDVVLNTDKLLPEDKPWFMGGIRGDNKEYVDVVLNTDKLLPEGKPSFMGRINDVNKEYVDKVLKSDIPPIFKPMFMGNINDVNKECVDKVLKSDIPPKDKPRFMISINDTNKECVDKVLNTDKLSPKDKSIFMRNIRGDNKEFVDRVLKSDIPPKDKPRFMENINDANKEYARNLLSNSSKMEIQPDKLAFLLGTYGKISPKQLQKLNHVMGRSEVSKLSDSDLLVAIQMVDIYGKTNINEIPQDGKKSLLRGLVDCNEGLFNISEDLRKHFPLIPTKREDYCSLLPSIVRSIGIETNVLTPQQVQHFNKSMGDLSTSLAKVTDEDFAQMSITQEYSKNDFIRNTLEIVKDMDPKERQKVYDYFGFELHHNTKGNPETGFSITGYPVNLNNGKKLAQIIDPKTKVIVEQLRPEVIKFSHNNRIKCDNPEVEQLLNDVVDVLPEVRTMLGKVQHGTHEFDLMKHSLKVMQKVTQDSRYAKLNESDKKLMLLASLLHDIKKAEGMTDKTHAVQSGFDVSFIARKFDLKREDLIKLYTLSRHHEWLEFVNTAKTEEELTKRLQSVAYDLQYDNLFEMAQIFTHADLKAVKKDNTFHDTTVGVSRASFDKAGNRVFNGEGGTKVSHGEAADIYGERIKGYIQELKKSQPLLPVTQIPKASKINEAITVVHPDGSTNIKGVYKSPEGLVVIKYNEVDDWESLGFPKGSISRGIKAKGGSTTGKQKFIEDVNTGNIKFFAHAIDYENQLAKFDAFSLIDSDVLLSISYAERPESKFRFFRTQGVLLDFDTKYIHGGGNTDSGSGCGKFIEDFKKDYIFGGVRKSDRLYVSDLIKDATGMNDKEYIKFVEQNKNKSLGEIEPKELQEVLVKAYASINSNTRKGARSYNEMYGSNPKEVMATFAYSEDVDNAFGNPFNVLQRENTKFLQKYALENNIPMIVFGD